MIPKTQNEFVVSIGASAGGVPAILALITQLPDRLDAPVVIAVHSDPTSTLAEVLKNKCSLPIKTAEDREKLKKGWIYVVPGARHMFFRNGKIHLSPMVQGTGFRPSIDALFVSMASEYGDMSVAVVLSGELKDGMRGAQIVYDVGGQVIVQNPNDAKHSSMPNSVIGSNHPDAILSAEDLGVWLSDLIGTSDDK